VVYNINITRRLYTIQVQIHKNRIISNIVKIATVIDNIKFEYVFKLNKEYIIFKFYPMAGRMRMLLSNYISAKKEGVNEGFDIQQITEDNFEHFYILFKPKSGLYKDQHQILEMKTVYGNGVSYKYPLHAPLIKFVTNVYHTNISKSGSICLDILKDKTKWMPTYDFAQIIYNIMLLYQEPNNSSPFNGEASRSYVDCEKVFNKLKHKHMSLEEEEKLKDKCFDTFKCKADTYAKKNNLKNFTKWFPQIEGKEHDPVELAQLESMYELVNKTNKKKPVSVDDNVKDPKKPKKNKWAKYQKKKPDKPSVVLQTDLSAEDGIAKNNSNV
jgi:ubiquitin-protein ligase